MKKLFSVIFLSAILSVILSICSFASETNTILIRDSGKIKCSVSLTDISEGSVIVISGIIDGRTESCEARTVSANDTETFYVSYETNFVKVFVLKDAQSLSPVTKSENIEVKLDSITDPDWSEWV